MVLWIRLSVASPIIPIDVHATSTDGLGGPFRLQILVTDSTSLGFKNSTLWCHFSADSAPDTVLCFHTEALILGFGCHRRGCFDTIGQKLWFLISNMCRDIEIRWSAAIQSISGNTGPYLYHQSPSFCNASADITLCDYCAWSDLLFSKRAALDHDEWYSLQNPRLPNTGRPPRQYFCIEHQERKISTGFANIGHFVVWGLILQQCPETASGVSQQCLIPQALDLLFSEDIPRERIKIFCLMETGHLVQTLDA